MPDGVPTLPVAVAGHDARLKVLQSASQSATKRLFGRLTATGDWASAWTGVGPRLVQVVSAAQVAAAADSVRYMREVIPELGIPDDAVGTVNPKAFGGVASDGRSLEGLVGEVLIRAKVDGLPAGLELLQNVVRLQVQDAARDAAGVGMTVRPHVTGWVRMLVPPSCSRCMILAGKWSRREAAFSRHPPTCDCRNVPARESDAADLTVNPRAAVLSGQVTGLSKGSLQAIRDGADPAQVVNAYRGMAPTGRFTREGVTRRRGLSPRLSPNEISRVAGSDRAEAVRLLRANGYIL